jgi:hypothetical protein
VGRDRECAVAGVKEPLDREEPLDRDSLEGEDRVLLLADSRHQER